MRNGRHYNSYIQQDYNRGHRFSFSVLEYCTQSQLNQRKNYWIRQLNTFNHGYNQTGRNRNRTMRTSRPSYTSYSSTSNQISSNIKKEINASNLNKQLSYVESIHSYPINTEIRSLRTYNISSSSYMHPTMTFGLNTSLYLLPKIPMQPRIFDPRVGFFTDGHYKYSDNQQQVERCTFVTLYFWATQGVDIPQVAKRNAVITKHLFLMIQLVIFLIAKIH